MHTMNTNTPITTRLSATTFNPMLAILSEAKAGSRSAEQARYRSVVRNATRSVMVNSRGDREIVVYEFTMTLGDLLGMAHLIGNACWGLPVSTVDDRDHIVRVLLGRVALTVEADRAAREESVELAS